MTDEYQTVTPSHNGTSTSAGSFEGTSTSAGRFGAYEDSAEAEDQPADYEPNLVSLGFLTAALRRGRRLWCAAAVAGLLIGSIGYVATRDPYQA